ncbi:MAG TPA: tyrosine-type recombinase/integrase [Polyangiales bacterium]|nr:tyrosine-type recombinase/integrase [Polyangiales bacterium]
MRHTRELPRALQIDTLRKLLHGCSTRDRIMIEWALYTGMRRIEVAALQIPQLATTNSVDSMPAIRLVVTKGMRPRTIYPPRALIERTRAYVREERSVVIKRASRRPEYRAPDNVFLKRDGSAVSARNLGAMFAYAARRAQVTATYHSLRHTFACTMLRALQTQAGGCSDMNPLLTLQTMLGHSSIATTSIYLRVLGHDLAGVERSIGQLYETML